MYAYAANNPVRYIDPDGRVDCDAELEYAKKEVLQTFNCDFGADFLIEAQQDWNSGDYFSWAIHELDATAEIVFDLFGIYKLAGSAGKGVKLVSGLFRKAGKQTAATAVTAASTATKIVTTGKPVQGSYDVVYGASGGGKLRSLAVRLGSKLLQDFGSLYDSGFSKWIDYSKYTLNKVANAGGKVLFDLSNISNINDALKGIGPYGQTVTSQELRYIRDNWNIFKNVVQFCKDGQMVEVQW